MKLPDGWSAPMVASMFKDDARALRRTALDLEITGVSLEFAAQCRREARNLLSRRRRLLRMERDDG